MVCTQRGACAGRSEELKGRGLFDMPGSFFMQVGRCSDSFKPEREEAVMSQITPPSVQVLRLMKLLMRSAICLCLLSPRPRATPQVSFNADASETWREEISKDDEFLIF